MKPKKTQLVSVNDERAVRIKKLEFLRDMGIAPYPSSVELDRRSIHAALQSPEGEMVSVAGRFMGKRDIGKITFGHIQDESGRAQVVFKQDGLGKENYQRLLKQIDMGDILAMSGTRFVTKAGEASILVSSWMLLAKALLPLPDKYHGLQEEELRLRKRYLDILLNQEKRKLFYRKSVFWNAMRHFLQAEGFLEVETPVLETIAGGADAKPFATHHDALNMDVYLRISMGELWQKRLIVGGFEKTFEIGRQFRNEGMSREHLQDYTQMEFYWAYANYVDGMALVERMYRAVIQETFGTLQFDIGSFKGVDMARGWERIEYVEAVKETTGVDVLSASEKDLKSALVKLRIPVAETDGASRLMDHVWKHCRKFIKGPAFLVHHPIAVSPLAKRSSHNPALAERYQVIIAGSELGNGYSELNDPLDQAARFVEQAKLREAGDVEAQMPDRDFIEALEYGMPPTTGFGVSERLFAFLEDKPVRECVLFPLMKPET